MRTSWSLFKEWGERLYLGDLFLVGSLERGSAPEPLCAKTNRKKGNLETKQNSALEENIFVSIDSNISFLSF